jgi:signal transduction histidine kinase
MLPAEGRGRLSHKMLVWFLLISLVPMVVVGWHLVEISLTIMKDVSLRNQQNHAKSFAETVNGAVNGFKNVLEETAKLGEFASMNSSQQREYISKVMQVNPAFLELSVIDMNGAERCRIDRFMQKGESMRDFFNSVPFQTASQRHDYIGALERFQGVHPALTIAVPVITDVAEKSTPSVKGVLFGKVSMAGFSKMLENEFPEREGRQAALATPDGFLVAHSSLDKVYRMDPRLSKDIASFLAHRSTDTGGGEVTLEDGTTALGAYATVSRLGWLVYVQQPLEAAYRAATAMRTQVARIMLWVICITVVLSLAVSAHITLPIRELQGAAEQLKAGRFDDLPEMTLPNDEIGDLGQEFLQMSDTLREKNEELVNAKEERLAAMGQMASVVGHEIRNPLAVINNSIFYIKTKLTRAHTLDEKISKHIVLVEGAIQNASSIINEILTYSRTRELKPQPVQLNHFVAETLANLPFPPNIQLVRRLDERNPTVNIDVEEMKQALRNLVMNAVDVMPQGGHVFVSTLLTDATMARIEVQDTGPGIQPDILDSIFMPFFTTKASGTGLGLAVVRKVMERHDGKVDVYSEVGRGSMFRLSLPLESKTPS